MSDVVHRQIADALANNPESLPRYAEALYAEISPYIQVDFMRFRNEYVYLRLFAVDYSLARGASHDAKLQEIRDDYTACIGKWARDVLKAPEMLYDVQSRFDRYGQAVNSGYGSPFIGVAKAFLEFCDCSDHIRAGRAALAVQSEVAMLAQAVPGVLTSW